MTIHPLKNRTVKYGIPLIISLVAATALIFTLLPKSEANAGSISLETSLATIVEELKVTEETRAQLGQVMTALNERNGQAQALLDNTAGKVLDDAVRIKLQADWDVALQLFAAPDPVWQKDAEALIAQVATANAAYDVSAPAVTANHEQWVIATTPPPPPPPVVNNGGGSKKPSTSGGGGSSKKPSGNGGGNSNGGGGGSGNGGGGNSGGGGGGGGWSDGGVDAGDWDAPLPPGFCIEGAC